MISRYLLRWALPTSFLGGMNLSLRCWYFRHGLTSRCRAGLCKSVLTTYIIIPRLGRIAASPGLSASVF
jgi:hypothetical protein